ncbi:MAG: hypothetical protein K0Q49_18 [Haloplasmataceae bacterium]|jgi:hypothetical protein|nr:hypothetical protein [Haloplasmataceae bacterium]
MNWFKKFMNGRYGGDQLSLLLLIISVVISLIASITDIPYLGLLSFIPLIIAMNRMLSRNISKRQKENYKLVRLYYPIKNKMSKRKARLKDKENRYFKCSICKTILRVPKGKGKITVTCPKCKNKLIKKT